MTPTTLAEAEGTLVAVLNRIFDKIFPKHFRAGRKALIDIGQKRLRRLFGECVKPKPQNPDVGAVKNFYSQLLKKPETKEKLEKLKLKKQRNGIFPSSSDMHILAEAVALKKDYTPLYFIHRDSDYGWFLNEINATFGLIVVSVEEVDTLPQRIEGT